MTEDDKNKPLVCPNLAAISAGATHLKIIVAIHMSTFKGFFLESLGSRFLRELYRGYIEDPYGICLVAINGTKVVGFVAGTTHPDDFFRRLLRNRWYAFALAGASSLTRHPIRVGRKYLSAIHYRGEKPQDIPRAALLSSIGVAPGWTGKGVGRMLLSSFCENARTAGAPIVYLTTDRDGNDAVNQFYCMNGFRLYSTFQKDRNRWMNLYTRIL